MAEYQVTCIRKPHPQSPHEHITHLGSYGQVWTREQVIWWIESGGDTFYTLVGGRRAVVRVVRPAGRDPYLQTYADGSWNNNLLSLPQCP